MTLYYFCASKDCAKKTDRKRQGFPDKANMKNQKCSECGKKGPWEATDAPDLGIKDQFNLQKQTVNDYIGLFVIDEHQSKHYDGGESGAAQFEGETWQDVHRIIVYCAKKLLELQKQAGRDEPTDGFVKISGLAADYWPAGSGKGKSNAIKVQMGLSGAKSSASREFSGHGYPVDKSALSSGSDTTNTVTIVNGSWGTTTLSGDNNERRMHK